MAISFYRSPAQTKVPSRLSAAPVLGQRKFGRLLSILRIYVRNARMVANIVERTIEKLERHYEAGGVSDRDFWALNHLADKLNRQGFGGNLQVALWQAEKLRGATFKDSLLEMEREWQRERFNPASVLAQAEKIIKRHGEDAA